MPTISVIVCTYGRASALTDVFKSLAGQSFQNFEVLLVDGNGENSPLQDLFQQFAGQMNLHWLRTSSGLTHQRNAGLRAASGQILCFLDDDVSFDADFLARIESLFASAEMAKVGGITGYDVLNYPTRVTARWRLRRFLGVIPSLKPGDADHLGRAVPVSFLEPFSGCREIGWLSGFCMIYRRAAVEGLEFDEGLPTYGGEDRDFSARVGRTWQLMVSGDLHIRHHYSRQGRASDVDRMRQTGYGTGRRFAKYARSISDYWRVVQTILGDFAVDLINFVSRPSKVNFWLIFARLGGSVSGFRSWPEASEQAR